MGEKKLDVIYILLYRSGLLYATLSCFHLERRPLRLTVFEGAQGAAW